MKKILKEKKNAEKLAAEAAEKQRLDKLKRNAEMFDRLSSKKPKTDDRKKKSKPEVNEDFLAELNKLKAKKLKEKLASNSNDQSTTKKTEHNSASSNTKSSPKAEPPPNHPKNDSTSEKPKEEIPLSKLTPRERLARLRAEKEAEDKKRLDALADGKNSFDKVDMKLLFSQKW